MSLFGCDHRWEEVGRTFNPPPERKVHWDMATESFMRKLAHGFTVVELRCSVCSRPDTYEFVGKRE